MTPAVLLLAAGASSRMRGGDKLLEEVDGMPLLRRQAAAARSVCEQVFVTLPVPGAARRAVLDGLDVVCVDVPDAAEGMSASIRAGAAALPHDVTHLVLLPADMPDIGARELATMLAAAEAAPGAVLRGTAEGSDVPGHPVLIPARLFSSLATLSGDDGARGALRGETVTGVPLPGRAAITDLDTPEDWAAWRARL
ncbi:nucleotidyltransferase family protein [Anianabacter salinae]|uniref:nucleotidyltransferase family protein n=1 Tax=Anianabacter salinae TaxID=2851023 RepID=UPI00225DEDE8|nr:nucleotidyltransferase family protein [Anianabacter salinae]MBV0912156.1 nucleotidyltransferase family protein [Anianabacter salinae]